MHVLPTRAGGLSNVETFGRIALRGPDNHVWTVVSCPLKEDSSSKNKPSSAVHLERRCSRLAAWVRWVPLLLLPGDKQKPKAKPERTKVCAGP